MEVVNGDIRRTEFVNQTGDGEISMGELNNIQTLDLSTLPTTGAWSSDNLIPAYAPTYEQSPQVGYLDTSWLKDMLSGIKSSYPQQQQDNGGSSGGGISDIINNVVKGASSVFAASAAKGAVSGATNKTGSQAGIGQNPNYQAGTGQNASTTKNPLLVPMLIGGGVLLTVGIVIAVAMAGKKK